MMKNITSSLFLTKKIKAVSIIESLIAIVLITIVFGISMRSYLNVMQSTKIVVKNKANLIVQEIAEEVKTSKKFIDAEFEEQGFLIQQKIFPYLGYKDIYQLEISALDPENKIIETYKELFFLPK